MGDDEDFGFKINKSYADKYNKWREKEELQKLKDKYGDVEDDSSSSEDEDAEGLTTALERDWLRTYAAIKSRDPKIYNQNVKFYEDDEESGEGTSGNQSSKEDKIKPMFLKDYERKVILEKGGIVSDDSESSDENSTLNKIRHDPSYFEEQEAIKRSFKEALPDSDSDEELLTRRKRTKTEKDKEEDDYHEWLKGQKQELGQDSQVGVELEPLKKYWTNPTLDEGEKFLRDFILNKQYLDENSDRIPSYYEIVDDENLSEEEKELEKQEDFERKYNFRFEEPDPEFIKSYPRTIGDSVRRKKDKRAKKREEIKERKKQEKEKKMDELKQLKNLKKREIIGKLDRLKEITGNPTVGFSEKDMEGDFDPSEHDRLMKQVFSEDYYDIDDDMKKPVFSDDEELGIEEENWDDWPGPSSSGVDPSSSGVGVVEEAGEEYTTEDPGDFNMDADFEPEEDRSYGLDGRSKKGKKKSKFKQALERRKPMFNPDEKTFEQYFDEYYKLDYEDIIDDQPCRFKYRKVPSNDFGLTTDEVFTCRDKELNAWVSLKKMSQYRTEEEEEYDKRMYYRKAKNPRSKINILTSLAESESKEEASEVATSSEVPKKKRKRKRKNADAGTLLQPSPWKPKDGSGPSTNAKSVKAKTKFSETPTFSRKNSDSPSKKKKKVKSETELKTDEPQKTSQSSPVKKKKKKKGKGKGKPLGISVGNKGFQVSEERLKAYGIDPKKFKYTHMEKLKMDTVTS